MNRKDYETEALRQLSDNTTYLPLRDFPSPTIIYDELQSLLIHYKCPPSEMKYILQLKPQNTSWAKIYFLTKIHKKSHPGRPICSQLNTLTYYASKYLHTKLIPFVNLIPNRLTDSIILINKLNNMEFTENCVLLTADIANLYPNIDHNDGILKVTEFLKDKKVAYSEISLMVSILRFILNNNWFSFGELKYKQIKGTAMGTPCAVMYADIYIYQLELNTSKILAQPFTNYIQPILQTRWIDDILQISSNINSLLLYIETFNQQHPNIQIPKNAVQIGQECNFLDMTIYRPNKYIRSFFIKLYSKPMNTHQYLHFNSNHPKHIYISFINSELNCILLRSTSLDDCNTSVEAFYSFLRKRDYNCNFLDQVFSIHDINSWTHDEHYFKRNKLIAKRILNLTKSYTSAPLCLMIQSSQSQVNWKRILSPTRSIEHSEPYISIAI